MRVAFRSPPSPGAAAARASLEAAMEGAATSAFVELLAAYGVAIKPAPAPADPASAAPLAALGVVRFTATGLSGTASVGAAATTLRRSNGNGTSHRDWIAELGNQFIGRFKLKLLRAGFELWSMAPVAVSGRLLATGISLPDFPPFAFLDAHGGALALWIDLEITGEIKVERPDDGEIPREGDIILF